MYISEIDDILDQTLDKFMYTWILEPKIKELITFEKIIKDPNFIKYQQDINKIIEFGQDLIPDADLTKFVTKNANILLIKNLISKYISYYLFILIGINYNGKIELFNNNLIEFSRNQSSYALKIDDFFNTESNSSIIKTINLINEFVNYAQKMKKNQDSNSNVKILENSSQELQNFIKLYSETNSDKIIELINSPDVKNKIIIDHNIIKIMIYINLYKSAEKKDIFNIIENTETSNGEFIFIDVVVPRSIFIDFSSIESILTPNELKTNLPETIYELINDDNSNNINDARKYFTDYDQKIQKLLDTHLIVPIVDDFILYHKDNEKYEKQGDKLESPKKKDETKIKYIINKINTISEYYKNPEEIKKLFYIPLQDRNAVLVNNYEDLKILSKMKNIIKMNNENSDLFNDLINYRMYPYISFKDFKANGFVFGAETTLDAIRNVGMENIKKKSSIGTTLQTRIISQNMLANIVGFAIINNDNEINCLSPSSFVNITEDTNEPLPIIKALLENKIKNKIIPNQKNELNKNYYWLFDLSKQKYSIPFYDISNSMPKNEIVKIITAYLYDYTIETIISIIKSDVNTSHPKLITEYVDSFSKYSYLYPDITNPQYANDVNELEYLMYYVKSKQITDTYDYNEDLFPGLYGDTIKLPHAPNRIIPNIPILKFKPDFKNDTKKVISINSPQNTFVDDDDIDNTNEYINAVCQHVISWDKIGELKKMNDAKYSDLIYEFYQQYIDISAEQDYVCKSCKSAINVKKFILDGVFDNSIQSYVTYSVKMDVNIEDLPKYEKYKMSIRNIEKIIERMGSIFNIQGLNGNTYSVRSKRKAIVKDTIDLVLSHNVYLKKYYLPNRDSTVSKYGINKLLSNFFIFDLDNSIFVYSSKDKDFYKIVKYNNIVAYILILLILELNDTQLLALANDKICSYLMFKKIDLFEGINIIVNKSYDIKPIKDFPVLCYIIYLTSCFATKYNLWGDVITTDKTIDKKKFNPKIQKSIINTVSEILNTILMVDLVEMKLQKNYLYDIFQTKYYLKLDFFADPLIIAKLDSQYSLNSISSSNKINIIDTNQFDQIPNDSIYNIYVNDDLHDRFGKKFSLERYFIPFQTKKKITMNSISNLSNCLDGNFHDFKINGKNLVCTKCSVIADANKYDPKLSSLQEKKHVIIYLKKLATKYCSNGQNHQFEYNSKKDISVCKKCNYQYGTPISLSDKELYKMFDIIEKNKKKNNILANSIMSNIKLSNANEIKTTTKIFNKIMYKYQKYDNLISTSIDILLDSVQKLLGTDIIIGSKTYNLYHNIYIIDHNYNGAKLEAPIQIYDKENKFKIINSHPYFKRNVLVYSMYKNTKYEIFYDLQEKILLGYREINKEYISQKKSGIKLHINYSIKNMFLLLGFTRQQINIKDFYPEIYGMTGDEINNKFINPKNPIMNDFINKIAMQRFNVVKKLGVELNKYINRFKYKYNVNLIVIEANSYYNNNNAYGDKTVATTVLNEAANNPYDIIYVKYQKKIDSEIIVEVDEKNNIHRFLKYMTTIVTFLPFSSIQSTDTKYNPDVDYNTIIKDDISSNIVLNYIIDEIIRLINYNTNKSIKTNIIHFILDLVYELFSSTNLEISKSNTDLNYFYQILYTSEFYLETQNAIAAADIIDSYSEQHNKTFDVDKIEDTVTNIDGAEIVDEEEIGFDIDDAMGEDNEYEDSLYEAYVE